MKLFKKMAFFLGVVALLNIAIFFYLGPNHLNVLGDNVKLPSFTNKEKTFVMPKLNMHAVDSSVTLPANANENNKQAFESQYQVPEKCKRNNSQADNFCANHRKLSYKDYLENL